MTMGAARSWLAIVATLALAAWGCSQSVLAQEPKAQQPSPVGGQWQTKQQPNEPAVAGVTLDAKQLEAVNLVSGYFNQFQNMKGTFLQTDPEKRRLRGKFFVKRPGKLRFEYNLPSKQLIVSDGQQVAIQDLDLKTDDRIALDQTPFRILLRKDVDLVRDAKISEVQEADDLVIITLQDKSPEAPGRIRLFMSKAPQLELKEWVTTDSQGKDTRVEVANLVKSEEIDQAIFKIVNPGIRSQNQ